MILPVSVPAHSALMREAGEALTEALAEAAFSAPATPVIALPMRCHMAMVTTFVRACLARYTAPVQWVQTVQAMLAGGASKVVECGPGKVLAGLMRRIDRETPTAFIDSNDSLQQALQS